MNAPFALLLAFCAPLAGVLLIVAAGRHALARDAIVLATAATLFAALLALAPAVFGGAQPALVLLEPLPGLPLLLTVEPLGMLFALLSSSLWIITSLYSFGYMGAHRAHGLTRFYACFALSLWAATGMALAGNLLTLFVYYEILTLATWPLVTHSGTPEARRSGRLYLGLLLGTSISLLLLAIIWTWQLTGTLAFVAGGFLQGSAPPSLLGVLLLLYVFGIGKAALMPFHRWLPAAMVAPTPVSALLHAVAVVGVLLHHAVLDGTGEARPAAARVVLGPRREQLVAAGHAAHALVGEVLVGRVVDPGLAHLLQGRLQARAGHALERAEDGAVLHA